MTLARWASPLVLAVMAAASGCDDSNPSSFTAHTDDAGDGGAADDGGGGTDGCPILTSTLTVVVQDAVYKGDICDATVVASSGAASTTLVMQGNPGTCAYSAQPPLPAGTYTVTATAPNYLPVTQTGIVIQSGPCGDEAPTVTIGLPAAPPDAGSDAGAD